MRTTQRFIFKEVTLKGQKSGKCTSCGKNRKRVKRFCQTINPFNKRPDGQPKTHSDIYEELVAARECWLEEPFVCATCE